LTRAHRHTTTRQELEPARIMSELTQYNLFDDAIRECPFEYFRTIRQVAPVYFMPELGAYYVSRYEDIRYVKKHPELFSNDIFKRGGRQSGSRSIAEQYRAEHGWERVSTLQRTDPPIHTRYRRLINHAFTVARVRTMTGYIETVVNDLIDAFIDKGECDFVSQFAVPLPCTVIADQLGVPRDMIWKLKIWSDAMLAPGGGFVDEQQALACAKLVVEAQQFFASVIEDRRRRPRDDIISELVHTQLTDERTGESRLLDMHELQDLLDQLLTGGNETTTNALGSAMMLLMQRPGTIERMRDDPKLVRNFIEEALRFETPVLHLWRVATVDAEIAGVPIPKGSNIALGYASANRDEEVFVDPETFDVGRAKAGAHLAFGSGPHHCPGAALARQELFSAFMVLFNRLDNVRPRDPQDRFLHVPSSFLRGLARLDLVFEVRNRPGFFPAASAY